MNKVKVNAVVVTYNRKKLLKECLDALLRQTYKINKIIIIDNASNDGTDIFLKEEYSYPQIEVYTLNKNTGGAGGFYLGTKLAYNECDWVWEMDDDTIPEQNALEALLTAREKIDGDISFLASTVFGIDGEPMNVPVIDGRPTSNGYSDWYKYLKYGIIKIEQATLVSLLINSNAIKKIGAPHPDFFIWGDDTEYTLRMTHYYAPAYYVGDSIVLHKRIGAKNLTIFEENNPNRIKLYKLYYRNNLVSKMVYMGRLKYFKALVLALIDSFKCLVICNKYRILKFKTIQAGILEFIVGKYGKEAFNNRFCNINEKYLEEYLAEEK